MDVALISGRRVSLEADLDAPVESLKRRAQKTLGVGTGRLLNASGGSLCGDATLVIAGWQAGDCRTLQIRGVQVCGGRKTLCFAALLGDGSVVTWGKAAYGNSSAVQDLRCLCSMIIFSDAVMSVLLEMIYLVDPLSIIAGRSHERRVQVKPSTASLKGFWVKPSCRTLGTLALFEGCISGEAQKTDPTFAPGRNPRI